MRLIIILAILLCCLLPCSVLAEDALYLHIINVGKADAMLLKSGESVYLIDTGTEESWPQLSCALHSHGYDRLSGVIITHTDSDHGGGAAALAQSSIQVDAWYAPVWYTVKEKKHPAILAATARGQNVTWLKGGDSIPLEGGSIAVLGPVEEDPDKENNNSLVLLVQGGGGRMLLAGDMEFPEEESLLALDLIPRCQVLKVGNHGEDDATSPALIQAVQPDIAVISTNTIAEPDTPSPRVTALLRQSGAETYETQKASAGVLVTLSGGKASAGYAEYASLPEPLTGMTILDKGADDSIRLRNDSPSAIDLTDWFIFSEKGGQTFLFPRGAEIQPGETITVASQSSENNGDYLWPDAKVWHKSKEDAAVLYDPYGRKMAFLP